MVYNVQKAANRLSEALLGKKNKQLESTSLNIVCSVLGLFAHSP